MSSPVFVVWLLAWNRSGCKGMTRREQSNCCCGGWVDCLEEKEMGVRVCVASSCGMHPPSGGVGNYDLAVPMNGDVHGEHFPPLWSPLVYCLLSLCLDATYLASDKAVSTAPNLSTNLAIEFLFPSTLIKDTIRSRCCRRGIALTMRVAHDVIPLHCEQGPTRIRRRAFVRSV